MPTDAVRQFYERFPYPLNRDGHTTSRTILPSSFDAIRHHVWGGHWPKGRPFRALVAGGGTGDAVLGLGLSLAHRGVGVGAAQKLVPFLVARLMVPVRWFQRPRMSVR